MSSEVVGQDTKDNFHSRQTFEDLFSFQKGRIRFVCSKAKDDEIYRVREMITWDPTESGWTFRKEKYMTRQKYEEFISQNTNIPIVFSN